MTLIAMMGVGCSEQDDIVQLPSSLDEPSGVVTSRQHAGIYWLHEDNGQSNSLFAVDESGVLVAKIDLSGAKNVDWEDIALDDDGNLYLGDIGNNDNNRTDLLVYKVKEPDPFSSNPSASVLVRLRFSYPDQRAFPDEAALNFDSEALFYAQGQLYLLTKHRSNTLSTLYQFPNTDDGDEAVLEKLGTIDVGYDPVHGGGKVTAAATAPETGLIAVLTYHAIFILQPPDGKVGWEPVTVHTIVLDQSITKQCEGFSWDGDAGILVNEEGEMHRITGLLQRTTYP